MEASIKEIGSKSGAIYHIGGVVEISGKGGMEFKKSGKKVVYSKSLIIAAMLFSSIIIAANIVGQKPLLIVGLIVSAGSAIFPFTYLILVLVTEIFGRKYARSII